MKRFEGKEDNTQIQKVEKLRLAFCSKMKCHRAVSPTKGKEIERFFPSSSLVNGYTKERLFLLKTPKQSSGDT